MSTQGEECCYWRTGNLEGRERLGDLSTNDFWQGGFAGGGYGIGHSDDLVIGDGPTVAAVNTDQPLFANNGTQPSSATGGLFPNIQGQWSRREAVAKYTFDKGTVRMFGINGEAFAKLRYVWERNSVNNFDQDIMQAYMNPLITNTGFMTWMAFDNRTTTPT